jgi:hypothetical protein
MAQRALRIVHMLAWAKTRGMLPRNPASGLQRSSVVRSRRATACFPCRKLATLWHATGGVRPAWFGALVRALSLTGARRGEVFQFEPDQVDGAGGRSRRALPRAAGAPRRWGQILRGNPERHLPIVCVLESAEDQPYQRWSRNSSFFQI